MEPKPPTVFWGNKRVTHEAFIGQLQTETLDRLGEAEWVLLLHDTTSLDFSDHKATEGLGMLDNQYTQGIFVHTTLAVSAEGLPMGVMGQQTWVRPMEERGKATKRHETRFEDKESYKWVEACQR